MDSDLWVWLHGDSHDRGHYEIDNLGPSVICGLRDESREDDFLELDDSRLSIFIGGILESWWDHWGLGGRRGEGWYHGHAQHCGISDALCLTSQYLHNE